MNTFLIFMLIALAVANFAFFIFGAHLLINLIAAVACLASATITATLY